MIINFSNEIKLCSMKRLHFKAKDGLPVTADEYAVENPKGYIVLCHRSHFNRGEYRQTAPELNKLGFSCLAIDQRSGMQVLGVTNETYKLAKEKGLQTGYEAAKPDIEAAVDFAYKRNKNPIILVGSSYSASLALLIAAEQPERVCAVAAFSPGEYLKHTQVGASLAGLKIPAFVTSSKKEIPSTEAVISQVNPVFVTHFKPKGEGEHGSRVLWKTSLHNHEYWQAFTAFLAKNTS